MKNSVELLGFYGGDETHALSAWTSTNRALTEEKRLKIPELLTKKLKDEDNNIHTSPFEKSTLHFLVITDIATHIHIIKHRIGVSCNAESARYKELKEDKYYIPDDWPEQWQDELEKHTKQGLSLYHECLEKLEKRYGFNRKRAKESARFFRSYNTQIDADVMFNFLSFAHFYKLRAASGAQKEVRNIAKQMLQLVKDTNKFDSSIEAFGLK